MANTKGTSVISNPQGGGAQSGLGEKFSPDLFTGTGNFSVPIAVPPGRNGFQPELTLGYSSGSGNGPFGMGWALGIPGVTRKTSKGIPVYENKSDIFILSGAEDLVPVKLEQEVITVLGVKVGWERTYYRPRTEGLFARIIRHKKTSGEHYWEVRSKDGLISWYGSEDLSSFTSDGDPAVTANPELRESIFSWHLSKTEDPFGNVILYTYERDLVPSTGSGSKGRSYDQLYLKNIHYCQYNDSGETKYLCKVNFVYELRPDPFSAYKQGFETRMIKRCTAIETYTNAVSEIKTKTYHFNYRTDLPLNGVSLLESLSVEGHNGSESEYMPPLEFKYSVFDPARRELKEISGPLPINSIGESGFELVDVTGNGLPDLLQLNGVARYWTNKGNGRFSPPKDLGIAPSVRLGHPGVQFIDANGDGRSDLLVNDGITAGYFPGAFQSVWDSNSFRPYKQVPSFSFADPEVQLMDLDGDGITDVLRNGSRFECFYNDPEKGFYKVKTALKTFANFSFADPRIRFADMTGDGLQDIVLISSGRVQYWPNMGYGRFGQKINMTNAPVFPEQYDPGQVLLGDLDGDGQADIVFVENNKVMLYVNQSGNGFSDGVKIVNTPRPLNAKALRITDIMGTGQAGLLWSYGPDGGTPGKMYFIDFTKGNKPYVLQEMNNNMGSLTRVGYGSSVYHYLRDEKQPFTRWKTQLPFPVQVVDRVEVIDFLSGGKLVTEYKYHNGYWDGVEREFRGFAHVDSLDTESFERFNASGFEPSIEETFSPTDITLSGVTNEHYSPPTMTKSWFYVGPVGDGFSRWKEPDFSEEYWSGDQQLLERSKEMKDLLASLPRRARRDALRTLRGSLLRSELYALDKSSFKDKPYTVTESLMSLRKPEFDPALQPIPLWNEKNAYWSGGGYVFFPFNIAQRTTQYERGTDPMHNFSFTKKYDDFGQPLGQLTVAVPRGLVPQTGVTKFSQPFNGQPGNYLASYRLGEFIYKAIPGDTYMVNRVKRSLGWDVSQSALNKSVFKLRDDLFAQYTTNPLDITFPVIACSINYYDDLATPFTGRSYGVIDEQGALVRTETLVITNDIIGDAYSSTPICFQGSPNWNVSPYPTTFPGLLQNTDSSLGYTEHNALPYADGWYNESARLKYDTTYGLVLESKDVFDNLSTIAYDTYFALPVSSKQYIDVAAPLYLETTADYDYRVMQPYQVKDVNDNYSVFDFSPLGLLRATALIGKGTEGDYKSGSGDFYAKYEPSVVMNYDFFAFKDSGDPVWVQTVSREKHYQDSAVSDTITKVEYSDGFGRLLQTRVQAENVIFGPAAGSGPNRFGSSGLPLTQGNNADAVGVERGGSDPLNVVVSGWKIYNNKGKVAEQYEPFFDSGFDFSTPLEVANTGIVQGSGVKMKMFYDPLGRVVKTINPDKTQQLVIYGIPSNLTDPLSPFGGVGGGPSPWINFAYDCNDLAGIAGMPSTNVPSSHHFTPKSSEVDALGRTIKTTEHIDKTNTPPVDNIVMQYSYDVRGNLLLVKDPYNRNVFQHWYDLRTPQKDQSLPPLKTEHIDKGTSSVLFDALGKPIESIDAKGAMTLSAYDTLQRPAYAWARNTGAAAIKLRTYMVYGDAGGTGAADNMNGKPFETFDEAGRLEFTLYDFKGNLLQKTREVVDDTVLQTALATYSTFVMDWDTAPALTTPGFTTNMNYDALNRITELELPQDLDAERKKIIPGYNRAGALEKVDLYIPTGSVTNNYVENIAYNAKGQRLLIAFGNSRMTRYVYDSKTFRLLRQKTEGYSKSTVGSTITYAYSGGTSKQDDGFNYDLVGNIVNIFVRVTDCGIGGTPDELDRTFEYDPIYRLTYADGRESNVRNWGNNPYDEVAASPAAPGDVNYYERNYSYDKLGNIAGVIQNGVNGFTKDYTYNTGKNTLQKIEDSGPAVIESYTYDNCGNTLNTNINRHYAWDHADRLICYKNQAGGGTPTVYTQYDYAGQERVSKLVRTGMDYERTIYIDGIFEYVKLENGTTYEKNYIHILDDKARIAEYRIDGTTGPFPTDISDTEVYLIEDQIGSSVIRLSASGTVIDEEEYYPFGDSSLRTFTYKRYRYVGKERDAESGLYYYGARYYAAWTCRFISVDPLAGKYVWQSSYVHADNNPINKVDHNGEGTDGDGDKGSKNATTATGANDANKCGMQPAQADPTVDPKNVRAAGTGGAGGATTKQNIQGKDAKDNLYPSKKEEIKAETRSEAQQADDLKRGEEINWSTPRAVAANILEMGNIIGAGMDVKSAHENGTDRKGRPMTEDQALLKFAGTALMYTPIKITGATTGVSAVAETQIAAEAVIGDLTQTEINLIQAAVDEAGRPIDIVGSAANGARRGVGTDLPIGKGVGTRSDIDYIASPSSHPYFDGAKLPSIDPKTGIIPGYGNPNIGSVIRFEPNSVPSFIPKLQ